MNKEDFKLQLINYLNIRYNYRYTINEDFLVSIKEVVSFLDTKDSFCIQQEWNDD